MATSTVHSEKPSFYAREHRPRYSTGYLPHVYRVQKKLLYPGLPLKTRSVPFPKISLIGFVIVEAISTWTLRYCEAVAAVARNRCIELDIHMCPVSKIQFIGLLIPFKAISTAPFVGNRCIEPRAEYRNF